MTDGTGLQHDQEVSAEPAELMLDIRNVRHNYGNVQALRGVTLSARKGEFLTILGESGSGKTTMLRVIAGLEKPMSVDRIEIDGHSVADVPAAQRNCTTVFQHYALFPHMSVGENVEYGLSVRGVGKEERKRRALEALELVRLPSKSERGIAQLSGGERQRVALARALVTHPAILLLDEPLGALDEKLRQQMQEELISLHRTLGKTFIYITHSQEEALTMSDRIALMRQGEIVQFGTPKELFDRPNSRFSADFMGFENIFSGKLASVNGSDAEVAVGGKTVLGVWTGEKAPEIGQSVCVAVRSERVKIGVQPEGEVVGNVLSCSPGEYLYRGKYVDQSVETELGIVRARIWDTTQQISDFREIFWRRDDCAVTPD